MHDPQEHVMRPVPEDETKMSDVERKWTRFQQGEAVNVKGTTMYIHEIGESRMVLKFKPVTA